MTVGTDWERNRRGCLKIGTTLYVKDEEGGAIRKKLEGPAGGSGG